MAEKYPSKSKSSKKSKVKERKMYRDDEENDDDLQTNNGDNSMMQKQQPPQWESEEIQIPRSPEVLPRNLEKKIVPMKSKQRKFDSEPYELYQTKEPQSLPAKMTVQKHAKLNNFAQQQYQNNLQMQQVQQIDFSESYSPLPPITTTQNLNDIFQTKLKSYSIKEFKVN